MTGVQTCALPIFKNVTLASRMPLEVMTHLRKSQRQVEKKLGARGRVLVRWSGTEPKLRVMVEGENQAKVSEAAEEIAAVRVAMNWPYAPFEIPDDVYGEWDRTTRGADLSGTWESLFAAYAKAHPELAAEFTRRNAGELVARRPSQDKGRRGSDAGSAGVHLIPDHLSHGRLASEARAEGPGIHA